MNSSMATCLFIIDKFEFQDGLPHYWPATNPTSSFFGTILSILG
jgi:hypothetical protein